MLKALLKKQFFELTAFYFQDRKTGKYRSAIGVAGFVLLFAFVFFSVGAAFYYLADVLADGLFAIGMGWLYFTLTGLLAIAAGVVGGAFTTYSGLYLAKDNEMLLSMPIPPSAILFVRMIGVYAAGLLYEAVVMVPALLVFWRKVPVTVSTVVFPVLLFFVIGFFVLVLTCLLGWLVALVSARVKNRSLIAVFATVAFLVLYYSVYFRIYSLLQTLIANAEQIGERVKSVLFLFYQMGRAMNGNLLSFLIFTGVTAVLFFAAYAILSVSFLRIATMNHGAKKTAYKGNTQKSGSAASALFGKELRRFVSSPVYLLNTGLGILLLPVAVIALFVKRDMLDTVLEVLPSMMPELTPKLPVLAAAAVCFFAALDAVTAPSVSLEGKNLWIIQTLPVDMRDVLRAKLRLHLVLNLPPILICTPLLGVLFGFPAAETVLSTVFAAVFVCFVAVLGLFCNLKKPNLVWTNETMPVKQSASVGFTLLGSFAGIFLFAGGCFFLPLTPLLYLSVMCVLFAAVSAVLYRWLLSRGAEILEFLS